MAPDKQVKEGSFVMVDYTIRDLQTSEFYATTVETVAKESGEFREGEFFPALIVVGEGRLLPSVENSLVGMSEGEKKSLELSPKEAYGAYDKSKLKTMSMRKIKRSGIEDLHPGDIISVEGERGHVKAVSGGRAQVDFNHPLAGKPLQVDVHVSRILRRDDEKIRALASDSFGLNPEKFSVKVKKKVVSVELPPLAYSKRDSYVRKLRFLSRVMRHVPGAERVRFEETFEIPKSQ